MARLGMEELELALALDLKAATRELRLRSELDAEFGLLFLQQLRSRSLRSERSTTISKLRDVTTRPISSVAVVDLPLQEWFGGCSGG